MELLSDPVKLHSTVEKVVLPATYYNYIDGKAVAGDLASFAVINPATGEYSDLASFMEREWLCHATRPVAFAFLSPSMPAPD